MKLLKLIERKIENIKSEKNVSKYSYSKNENLLFSRRINVRFDQRSVKISGLNYIKAYH